jgi:hypothetical protein
MAELEKIGRLEAQFDGLDGKPTLGRAYELLMARWNGGMRDRETALRLLFLSWYTVAEPTGMTGLESVSVDMNLTREFLEAAKLDDDEEDDELWFAVIAMTDVAPYAFPDMEYWMALAEHYKDRLGDRASHMDARVFEGRGAYGSYFADSIRFSALRQARAEELQAHRDKCKDD